MNSWLSPIIGILIITCLGCQTSNEGGLSSIKKNHQSDTKIFEKINGKSFNIKFNNKLTENDSINYFTYPYIYMGGGVAVGDVNNDGLTDLYFTGNMVENKLYLNKDNLKFEDITQQANVASD